MSEKQPNQTGKNRDEKGKFIKGMSGNPEGRPEGTFSLVSLLKDELQKNIPQKAGKEEKITYALMLIKKALRKAVVDEDIQMIKDIFNRIDGMPKQNLELGVDETIGEVKIEIVKNKMEKEKNDNNIDTQESNGLQKKEGE